MSTGSVSGPRRTGRRVPWSIPDVAPFAPGNVPNRLSNVRFSLIRNTTCLIGHRAFAEPAWDGAGGPEGRSGGASGPGGGGLGRSTQEAAIVRESRRAAMTRTRYRGRRRGTSGGAPGRARG